MMLNNGYEQRTGRIKLRHILYGFLVCSGLAHLILTTFEVPRISYIRVFLVGAVYTWMGIWLKFGSIRNSKIVNYCGISAGAGLLSGIMEWVITGGHPVAMLLMMFDFFVIYYVIRFWRYEEDHAEETAAALIKYEAMLAREQAELEQKERDLAAGLNEDVSSPA